MQHLLRDAARRAVDPGRGHRRGLPPYVARGRIARATDDEDAVTNPTMIVEVLSETTASDDRGDKWAHYQRIPALRHYVLVSQKEQRVEVFTREAHGWHYEGLREGTVELPALQASLRVDELYARALEG